MPQATMSRTAMLVFSSSVRAAPNWERQISSASCSTHPGCGYRQAIGLDSMETARPASS
jgi:hypothetical protein